MENRKGNGVMKKFKIIVYFDNVPNETELIASDYLKINQDFNGTGVLAYRTCPYESFSSLY